MLTPPSPPLYSSTTTDNGIEIPIEIVSEDEMAFIEAALSSTRSLLTSSSSLAISSSLSSPPSRFGLLSSLPFAFSSSPRQARSLSSSRSKKTPSQDIRDPASRSKKTPSYDIEDSATSIPSKSLLDKFRSRRGLMVTDITATEWCEKQMEFGLLYGMPEKTSAMKAGSTRHTELEKEVVKKVKIPTRSIEETWAVKFLNFIVGSNQLLFEGLTRELPVIGVFEGTWIVGVIDELRMPINDGILNPFLVDTKTRHKATLPSEAQKRNARIQLMCYKYLWDGLTAVTFPADDFFKYFGLNPCYNLSEDVKQYVAALGFHAETFEDVVKDFSDFCRLLPPSQDQLILRYEFQLDQSLLEEYKFAYDAGCFKHQVQRCLEFWSGEREANYVSGPEDWKCRFCKFTAMCPMATKSIKRAG